MSTTLQSPTVTTEAPLPTPEQPARLVTPEDLLAMSDAVSYELVDGHLVERTVSTVSSLVALELGAELRNYCKPRGLGWVFGSGLGYRCFPDDPNKVRKPDVSFVRLDRLPVEDLEGGYCTIVPDLAVEVVSPNDLAYAVEDKVQEYLGAGVPLVWVVHPGRKLVRVHRADGTDAHRDLQGELDGEAVLPGFRLRLIDLFPPTPLSVLPNEAD